MDNALTVAKANVAGDEDHETSDSQPYEKELPSCEDGHFCLEESRKRSERCVSAMLDIYFVVAASNHIHFSKLLAGCEGAVLKGSYSFRPPGYLKMGTAVNTHPCII